jgi:glycosyltransferase involved in cell wall biosynthesis
VNGVSVLIPVYNEAKILKKNTLYLLNFLGKQNLTFEIIIGSNGSDDGTDVIGSLLAKKYAQIKFFCFHKRGVVGRVFKEAVRTAQHEKILSLDIDLTIDLTFINEAINLLDVEDMVIGSKKSGRESRMWMRRLGSNLYIWVVKNLMGLGFSDYSIGAKAYRRSAILPHLNKIDAKTGYVLTLTYFLKKHGSRLKQIPVYCNDFRTSKFRLVEEGVYRFLHVLRLWLVRRKV